MSVPSGTTRDFWVVDFVDSQIGYCSTGNIDTFKTTNGGQTWEKVSTQGFKDFSFFNETVGFATSSSVDVEIARTINGGDDWTTLTAPVADRVVAVSSTSENTAYFAGNGGVLYKTTDGGTSFSILNSSTNYGINDFSKICFVNENVGYIAGDKSGVGAAIWKTTDAGSSWTIQNPGIRPGYLIDVDFYDENHGFAVGLSGLIL